MTATKDTLSRSILIAALTAIFAAVTGSYFDMSRGLDEARDTAERALRATVRIEARLKTMDDAAAKEAQAERERLKAEVLELQQAQRGNE
jgi:hypothetical protein